MDKTAYTSVPNGSGTNPASLEATGPPPGGPPNDPNLNNFGKLYETISSLKMP